MKKSRKPASSATPKVKDLPVSRGKSKTVKAGASKGSPMDPLINTAGRH